MRKAIVTVPAELGNMSGGPESGGCRLEQALAYHRMGWKILPLHYPTGDGCSCGKNTCKSEGKHPLLLQWCNKGVYVDEIQNQTEEIITAWFAAWPMMNVGIATGRISGILVLDIDGPEGAESFDLAGIELSFEGPIVETGRGWHVYFRYPEGLDIGNKTGVLPHVDIRANGGYIVAPPSIHISGRAYEWSNGPELELPECPAWLIEMLTRPSAPKPKGVTTTARGSESGAVIPKGARNDTLFKAGCAMRGQGAEEPEIADRLYCMNAERCEPPLSEDEVLKIAQSASSYPCGEGAAAENEEGEDETDITGLRHVCDPSSIQPPELIAGLFRPAYISFVVAAAGTGKSWLMQKLAFDLSLGGPILGGYSQSAPKKSLLFVGEAGVELMDQRTKATGWAHDPDNVLIYDARELHRKKGIDLTLMDDKGREMFRTIIEAASPDLVIIDSLGSFVDDESDRVKMKEVLDFFMKLADEMRCAVVFVHHLRKRKASERKLPISQDDVIGSSIQNRYASMIMSVEKRTMVGGALVPEENFVTCLKSWDRLFPPFSFRIVERERENVDQVDLVFDLNPANEKGTVANTIWNAIRKHFSDCRFFSKKDVMALHKASASYLKGLLSDWVQVGRLERRGAGKATQYRLVQK